MNLDRTAEQGSELDRCGEELWQGCDAGSLQPKPTARMWRSESLERAGEAVGLYALSHHKKVASGLVRAERAPIIWTPLPSGRRKQGEVRFICRLCPVKQQSLQKALPST
jgi:hypothetical protein